MTEGEVVVVVMVEVVVVVVEAVEAVEEVVRKEAVEVIGLTDVEVVHVGRVWEKKYISVLRAVVLCSVETCAWRLQKDCGRGRWGWGWGGGGCLCNY